MSFVAESFVDTSEGFIDIARLSAMSEAGETLPFAFGYNDEGLPELGRIRRAWRAETTVSLVQIKTEKGLSLRCVPDQVWFKRDGSEVRAADLKPGDRLRKNGRSINTQCADRCWLVHRPTRDAPDGKSLQSRWMWQQVRGPISRDHDIHHRNEDPTDDRLSNFQKLSASKHRSEHVSGPNHPFYIPIDDRALVDIYDAIAATPRGSYKGGPEVSPGRWNAYVRDNGLAGRVPSAHSGGRIRGMEWGAFCRRIAKARAVANDRIVRVSTVALKAPVPVYDLQVRKLRNFGVRSDATRNGHSVIVHNCDRPPFAHDAQM
jgi:hypothetical protein